MAKGKQRVIWPTLSPGNWAGLHEEIRRRGMVGLEGPATTAIVNEALAAYLGGAPLAPPAQQPVQPAEAQGDADDFGFKLD